MRDLLVWAGLYDHSGRRAWAFLSLLFGCGIMTAFAAVALYLVQDELKYVFWLGIAAHVQIFVALSGFMAFFIRRNISATRNGVTIEDKGHVDDTDAGR